MSIDLSKCVRPDGYTIIAAQMEENPDYIESLKLFPWEHGYTPDPAENFAPANTLEPKKKRSYQKTKPGESQAILITARQRNNWPNSSTLLLSKQLN
jgi:hypothetical protein